MPKKAGTAVELPKNRPIAEHVGASHHRYPIDVIGETLLKQGAILAVNNLPALINQLKEDLVDINNSRNNINLPGKNKSTAKSKKQVLPVSDEDTLAEIEKYEQVLTKAHHTKRRIKATSTTPSASTN